MLLDDYKNKSLLFNSNFLEQTSEAGVSGYRGEMVLVEGEAGDPKGHAKPPIDVVRGVVLLADNKLKLVVGAIDHIESINAFLDKYKDDLTTESKVLFYVVDIKKPVQVDVDGINIVFIPLVQGVPWNEVIDEMGLEKSDFKGQSPAEKILTLYNDMKSYKPKYESVSLEEALASAEDITREIFGAI